MSVFFAFILNSLFFILYSQSFVLPIHAIDTPPCNLLPVDYSGPQYAFPITSQPSCDAYDGDSALFDEFINKGEVRGVTHPELVGKYTGNKDHIDKLYKKEGVGNAAIDLDKNTNLAIDPEVLKKYNKELFTLKKVVSMSDNLSPVGINAECYSEGITDEVACADFLGATITYPSTGTKRVNSLTAYTAYQKLTTLSNQIKAAKLRAQEAVDCQKEGTAEVTHCGNNYTTNKAGETSDELATKNLTLINNINLNNGLTDYFKLPLDQQRQLLSQDNKKAQTTILVVRKEPNTLLSTIYTWFTGNEAFIIRGANPGLPNIVDGLTEDFKRWNTLSKGQVELAKIRGSDGAVAGVTDRNSGQVLAATSIADDGAAGLSNAAIKKVLAKVEGQDCGPKLNYSQLMGAISTSKSTGDINFSWRYWLDAIKQTLDDMYAYTVCAIDPPEYGQITQLTNDNPQSPTKSYYILDKAPSEKVDIPQKILAIPPTADNRVDFEIKEEITCPDTEPPTKGPCYKITPDYVGTEFSAPDDSGLQHQGGEFAWNLTRKTYKNALLTLFDPERFNQCSYAEDVKLRQPVKYGYLDADSLGMVSPQCKTDGTMACTDISTLSTTSDCTLKCDQVWGHAIPPTLKDILERIGSAYNIPPGLILGAMAAEGGFEPRCAGSDQEYTDADIQQMMCKPDPSWCQSCNNGSGPFGTNPYYFQGTLTEARNKLGLPNSGPGNQCSIIDGALITAQGMSYQAGFDNSFWYQNALKAISQVSSRLSDGVVEVQDSCHGIPYSGIKAPNCSSWTDGQAVAAIRIQQGFCGDGNKWMELHTQQILDVFHSCR